MVHFRLYEDPLGGVYVKLLSPERSSSRHVLIRASTGLPLSPEPDTRLHVQSSAPPFVKMQAYSSMLGYLQTRPGASEKLREGDGLAVYYYLARPRDATAGGVVVRSR